MIITKLARTLLEKTYHIMCLFAPGVEAGTDQLDGS